MGEEKEKELDKTGTKVERDEKGRILPGQDSLNPDGRPKGSLSIKSWIKKHLEENPEKFEELCKYYMDDKGMRDLLWKMIDGLPRQSIGFDMEEMITELNITIKPRRDDSEEKEKET